MVCSKCEQILNLCVTDNTEGNGSSDRKVGDTIKNQIENGFRRRDINHVKSIFAALSSENRKKQKVIPSSKWPEARKALIGLGACCNGAFPGLPDPQSEQLGHLDKNGDGEIDFDEFIDAANTPWPMECWARSLPLSELLIDCIPSRFRNQEQTFQSIGSLTDDEIAEVVAGFDMGLERLLRQHNEQMNWRPAQATQGRKHSESTSNSSSKFYIDVPEDKQGNIEDFDTGLTGRIGKTRTSFRKSILMIRGGPSPVLVI
jgi:hypothetical protein